jgi:hypothetical protein
MNGLSLGCIHSTRTAQDRSGGSDARMSLRQSPNRTSTALQVNTSPTENDHCGIRDNMRFTTVECKGDRCCHRTACGTD